MATATTDHYTIISADTHAGANHETYREYLDEKYVPDFDAWRDKYKNPWKDLATPACGSATGTTSGATPTRTPTASSAR